MNDQFTFGSLFAGIGGIDIGMEAAAFKCKWQVEIDEFATSVLAKHWPNVERYKDVKQFPPRCESGWLRHRWKEQYGVDVVCAGFPCQDVSYAGKGAGLDGERSGLFFEVIRVARELRPRAILLENVSALLNRGLDRVCVALAEIGFCCEWMCVPASGVGAPHIRDRIFILAYSERIGRDTWTGVDRNETQTRIRRGESGRSSEALADTNVTRPQRMRKKRSSTRRQNSNRHTRSSSVVRSNIARLAKHWSTEPAMGELVNGISGRLVRFAGRTAYRIPSRVKKLKALGNAVVPQVAEFVALHLKRQLEAMTATDREF